MNFTSFAFALIVFAMLAGMAWLIDWGARAHHYWPDRKRRLIVRGAFLFAIVIGVFTYVTDEKLRGTTLFEVAGPWEENADRLWIVEVEHPGIEHTLSVFPFVRGLDSAGRPITLRTRFGEEGELPLVAEDSVHEVVTKSGKYTTAKTWDDVVFRFIPKRAGPHQLHVEAVDAVPPLLHLRVVDPEKRDGKRTPGY